MNDRGRSILVGALCIYGVSTLISMAVMSIGAGILGLAMLFVFGGPIGVGRRLGEEVSLPCSRRYLWAACALFGAIELSLLVGWAMPLSFGDYVENVHPLTDSLKLWYLFWPLLIATALRALDDRGRRAAYLSWIVAFGILAVIGVAQHWTGWPRRQLVPGTTDRYHASLFLGFHLSVASILIFPFFAALDLGLKGPGPRWLWWVFAALGAVTLFFTQSRTLWVALPLGILLWIALSLPRSWAAALWAAVVAAVLAATQLETVKLRLLHGSQLLSREGFWEANLQLFARRPFTGVGWQHNAELAAEYLKAYDPSRFEFASHAHDNLLDLLAGTGLFGAGAWLFWSGLAMWLAWRSRRLGLLCAWVVLQINGLTQVNFWDAKVTHQLMWCVGWTLAWLGL